MSKITYPFPLNDGSLLYLDMPMTMTVSDARRLKRYISAIYINKKGKA